MGAWKPYALEFGWGRGLEPEGLKFNSSRSKIYRESKMQLFFLCFL